MKKLFSIFLAIVIVCSLCIIPASAASPKLNATKINLPIGYYITLKVSNADDVTWSTKDKSIATVEPTTDNAAKVVGVSTGSTYVYAKADGKTLKCKVTVKKAFITASNDTVSLKKGDKKSFKVSISGSKELMYSNSKSKVCAITSVKWVDGKLEFTVEGKSTGTSKIKVFSKGFSKSTAETITVTVSNSSKTTATQNSNTTAAEKNTSEEASLSEAEKVVELVNAERAKKGLSALTMDATLNKVAELRANELLANFSHTRPDGTKCFTAFDELGAKYGYVAENIAAGQSSAKAVMDCWVNSSGHYSNITHPNMKKIGVALIKSSDGYKYYWVQVFTD